MVAAGSSAFGAVAVGSSTFGTGTSELGFEATGWFVVPVLEGALSVTGLDSPASALVVAPSDGVFETPSLVSAFGATETEVSDFGADTADVSTTTGVVCLTVVVCSPVAVSVFVSTS